MKIWAETFYSSKAWKKTRDSFLSSKNYLCERCSTVTNPVPAKIAHHKEKLTPENINNPAVALAWENLEALCQTCHNRERRAENEPPRYYFDERGRVVPV